MNNVPSPKDMETNMMPNGRKSFNAINMDNQLQKSKTGKSDTHTKVGGKKPIDINKKMKKVMKAIGGC